MGGRFPLKSTGVMLAFVMLSGCASSRPPQQGAFVKTENAWIELPSRLATERYAGQVRAILPLELGETPSVWRHDLMLTLWWEETAPEYLGLYWFTLGAQPVGEVDIEVTSKGGDVYEVLPASRLEEGLYCLHEDDPFRDVGMFEMEWCFRVMP